MSSIETFSNPQAVSMADEWFELATADHFWMQWRHRLLVRALKRSGDWVRHALEIGCGHEAARDMLHLDALPFRMPFGTYILACGRLRPSVNAPHQDTRQS